MVEAIGLMSGSSLDGLDIAHCTIDVAKKTFRILHAQTVAFPIALIERLRLSTKLSGLELLKLDRSYSIWVGDTVKSFIIEHGCTPIVIGLHGHTVFHFPKDGLSYQMGHGSFLALQVQIPVITDFRTADIILGGEGAPLAPFVNETLFSEISLFLNLGGIANGHIRGKDCSEAFDICGCNQWLNSLAQQLGHAYDKNGQLAKKGRLIPELMEKLGSVHMVQSEMPSLDNADVQSIFNDIIDPFEGSIEDKLHTVCLFIGRQIQRVFSLFPMAAGQSVQITGGGAMNAFMIECIATSLENLKIKTEIPSLEVIHYKEALLIAAMAVYHMQGKCNYPSSLTKAYTQKAIGGIWHPVASK